MFRLSAQDNGLYFFRDRSDVRRCSNCNALLDKWQEDLSSVPMPRVPKYDLSYSYDGVLVASHRFKNLIDTIGIDGAEFRPLQHDLFTLRPSMTVEFDRVRRGTRFERQCVSCGQYESVVGATPVFLKQAVKLAPNVVVKTDLEFGSGDEKTPLVLFADDAAKALGSEKLRGVDLVRAKDKE